MDRYEFQKLFKSTGPAILPVIHALDMAQAERNVVTAMRSGAQGVFLINHDFEYQRLLPIIESIRQRFPALWLGANFLAVTGKNAFPVLSQLQEQGTPVDAYWADDARIDERTSMQQEAREIDEIRQNGAWSGMYFGGVAFKKQRDVAPADYTASATIACRHMDVVTTSGVATGEAADLDKIRIFRRACDSHPLAVASGINPQNVTRYANSLDAILIATGINYPGDFYNIDPARLRAIVSIVRTTCVAGAES